jgi:spore coat polysaccharide biosynthesis protein SpsF
VVDDGHERRLASDYAYYPPVPGAAALDWKGSRALPRIGWEWALLGLNPNALKAQTRVKDAPAPSRPTVLVAMGGSDPHGLTLRMAKALAELDQSIRIRFVIGTGMKDAAAVARGLVGLKKNYETVEGADDLSTEYASADLALCAFGVTAYELAALGIPAVYLGLTPDHAASASAFADAGMGISLGVADKVQDEDVARTVQWLLNKPNARRAMRHAGLSLIDGQGAARIAADLAKALAAARAPLKAAL